MEVIFITILAGVALIYLSTKMGGSAHEAKKHQIKNKIPSPVEQAFDFRNRLYHVDNGALQLVLVGAIYELVTYRERYPNIVDWLKTVDADGASDGLPRLAEEMQNDLRNRKVRGEFVSASHLMPLLFAVQATYDRTFLPVAIEIWNKLFNAREVGEISVALEKILTLRKADPSIEVSYLDLHFMPLAIYEKL